MKKGFVAPIMALIVVAMIVLISALGTRGRQNLFSALYARQSAAAHYAAEAGIERTIYDVEYPGTGFPTTCGSSNQYPKVTLPNGATYIVNVANNVNNNVTGTACTGNYTASDGTVVPPYYIYVTSTGTKGNYTGTSTKGNYSRKMAAMFYLDQGWLFPDAIAVLQNVNFNGGGTINGNIAANGTVSIGSNTSIDGTVSTTSGTVTGTGTCTSPCSVSTLNPELDMPPPPTDPYNPTGTTPPPTTKLTISSTQTLTPGQYGDVEVKGNATLTLSCGSYSINGLKIGSTTTLIIPSNCSESNPVKLWIYGIGYNSTNPALDISGGTLDNQSIPLTATTFLIYGEPTLQYAKIAGGTNSAFALYAPYTNVTLSGNSGIFGSIVANTVTAVNGTPTITYDPKLSTDTSTGLPPTPERKGWASQ